MRWQDLDYAKLKERCLARIEDFDTLGQVEHTPNGRHIFIDNGASVLAVAHLDTVENAQDKFELYLDEESDELYICTPTLDDRLGVYVLLDLLPSLGLKYDILLTEGEESGNSTAASFQTDKHYHWMFQFDRAGDDVVLYQYDTKSLRDVLQGCGFILGQGSFSDIRYLGRLGCRGINFGVGYWNNHSPQAFAVCSELLSQVEKFRAFFAQYHDVPMPYTPTRADDAMVKSALRPPLRWDADDAVGCELCRSDAAVAEIDGMFICSGCAGEMEPCAWCGQLRLLEGDEICWDCAQDIEHEADQPIQEGDRIIVSNEDSLYFAEEGIVQFVARWSGYAEVALDGDVKSTYFDLDDLELVEREITS